MLNPGTEAGPYEIVWHIGSGGMGDVYKGRDTRLGRPVALKVLPELTVSAHSSERFEHEAKAASALAHPNVCHIYMLGATSEGRLFIAMEYVQGETLRARVMRDRLPLKDTLDIAIQITSALVASHAAGVIHRDIKPENVMITTDGLVKVLDFGLAKFRTPFPSDLESTRTVAHTDAGVILGTVAYMSPEQARGQDMDARTDVWSAGAVLYEMVAGRPAFVGATSSDTVAAILQQEPAPLPRFDPTVPQEFVRIVNTTLRKDRDERYQTAKDLVIDLRSLKTQLDSGVRLTPAFQERSAEVNARAHHSRRRRQILIVATLVALAATLVSGYVWWAQKSTSTQSAGPARFTLKQVTSNPGLTLSPAMSRDGKLIAYASDRAGDHLDLWVQQVAGGEPLRLTTDGADDSEPVFSSNGTDIVFRSERGTGGIYRISAFGGAEQLIVAGGRKPRISPDGRWIAYWTGRPGSGSPNVTGASSVFIIEFDGGTPRQIAPGFATGRYPLWSPDGTQLLFFGSREAGKQPDWCLARVAQPNDVQCLDVAKVIGEAGALHEHHAATDWADGYAIYDQADGDAHDLWRIAIDLEARRLTSEPERLTYGPGDEVDAVFGASGNILFTAMQSLHDIWRVKLDPLTGHSTGPEEPVTADPAVDMRVRASADGSTLVFVSNRAAYDSFDVWIRDLRTNRDRRVTSGQRVFHAALDPTASRVAYHTLLKDRRELHVVTLATGQNETICEKGCGSSAPTWSRDGSYLLIPSGREIGRIEPSARKWVPIVSRPPYRVCEPDISPDGTWLTFLVRPTEAAGHIVIAPLSGDQPIAERDWITVSADGTEDKPRWSADGKMVYFTSERDGFRCIWAQPIDMATGEPLGNAVPVHHSHRSRRSLKDMDLAVLGIGVTRNDIFFNQSEDTGNVWMMRPSR